MSTDDAPEAPTDPMLVVPIVEITRRIGTRRPFVVDVVLRAPTVAGIAVPDDRPVHVDLVIESVLDGIVVEGVLAAPWHGECRRCLEPIDGTVEVPVRELFEAHPTPGETYPIETDHIDLTPLVRDAVLLSLPLTPLCREDCPGPDPERFPTTVEADEPEVAAAPAGDPRWAALDVLRGAAPPDDADEA